jgi:hypothetical protein
MQTSQTLKLKLETFKNSQTGNTAELLMNEDNICLYYREPGELGLVEAGQDHKGAYWATWTSKSPIYLEHEEDYMEAESTGNRCLDDALNSLECELVEIYDAPPWRSWLQGFNRIT